MRKMRACGRTMLRVNGVTLSKRQIEDEFIIPRVPVIVQGLADHWKAKHAWVPDALLKKYGDTEFECGRLCVTEPNLLTLKNYLSYCESIAQRRLSVTDAPLYLFDPAFADEWNTCANMACEYSVPHMFEDDIYSALRADLRPDYRWILLGPAGSGSQLHVDPLCTSAWNTLIAGRKKWAVLKPLTDESSEFSGYGEIDNKITVAEWFERLFQGNDPFSDTRDDIITVETPQGKGFVFTQQPGETVFIPWGFQHAVLNLPQDDLKTGAYGNPTVAVTQNFIPKRSTEQICRFLEAARAEGERWSPEEFALVEATVRKAVPELEVAP